MKKIILSLVALVLVSFGGNAQNVRQTVAADAAGALGGAGSAAGIINFLSLTPPGWLVLGGGALVGGAAGSLAVYDANAGYNVGNDDLLMNLISNPENKLDYVGLKHNEILVDYLKINKKYDPAVFLEFSKRYDTNNKSVDIEFLSKQHSDMKAMKSYEDIVRYTLNKLPSGVDRVEFADFLRRVEKIDNITAFVSEVKKYENKLLSNKSFSDGTIGQLSAYFATLRYSSFLWDKK